MAWLNDPQMQAAILTPLPILQADEETWFESMLKRPMEQHPFTIEIQKDQEWISIGNCGIHHVDWRTRSAEVGILIGEKAVWNQGYGTEVMPNIDILLMSVLRSEWQG